MSAPLSAAKNKPPHPAMARAVRPTARGTGFILEVGKSIQEGRSAMAEWGKGSPGGGG